jgi:hypothetical protein
MPRNSLRIREKVIRWPVGCQRGSTSNPASPAAISECRPVPSAFITHSAVEKPGSPGLTADVSKTSRVPSGDHEAQSPVPRDVAFAPSAFMVTTVPTESGSAIVNTMRVPSGDQSGQ